MRKIVTRTYLDTPDPWSKPELQIRELESKRAQNLSARDLVLCFPLCDSDSSDWKTRLSGAIPCLFQVFSKEKNPCCSGNNAVFGWHTCRRRRLNDFWWAERAKSIFVLVLLKTTFPQTSFPSVGLLRMRTMTKQTNSHPSSLMPSDLKLSK